MPNRYLFTVEAAIELGTQAKTGLIASKARLADNSFVPDSSTTRADLIAAETALVGYPAGGYAVAGADGPFEAADSNGVYIATPSIPVLYASGAPATIGSAWWETAGGDIEQLLIFDPPITLAALPDGFPLILTIPFGQN